VPLQPVKSEVLSELLIVTSPGQAEVAAAVPVLAGKLLSVQEIVTSAGQTISGPATSVTVIV
jgi:hypothetical protein